jgi:hypothetical protein
MSDNNKREAINRMAQRVAQQSNISHTDARRMVVKHLTRADNKKRSQ